MNEKEFLEKAHELGLTEAEIKTFLENQKIAQTYGIDDEELSINVTIDKNINVNKEEGEAEE